MLKPKTILALFEDGSDEAVKFALPYAADVLRKVIKEIEEEEARYIKDEQEGKLMENSSPIKTEELCSGCLRRKECFFLRCEDCGLAHYDDDEDDYCCRCDSILLGECCPFYISCEK